MSYDIYLFKKLENKTVRESAAIVLESNINALDSKHFELQKKALSEKLKSANPKFNEFNPDNHLQLLSNEPGIQVYVSQNQIAVSVPYWHTDQEGEKIFTEFFKYLRIIREETGYSIYDAQIGAEMIIDQSVEKFLLKYLGVSENLETIVQNIPKS